MKPLSTMSSKYIQPDTKILEFLAEVHLPPFSPLKAGEMDGFQSSLVLIYPLVVANRRIMLHCVLEKPLSVPSVMFPSSSR